MRVPGVSGRFIFRRRGGRRNEPRLLAVCTRGSHGAGGGRDDPHVRRGLALTSDHTHLVYQRDILQAAKDAGILVFTITALNTAHHRYRGLVEDMTHGASRPDYAFVNNATPEAPEQAFRAIANTVSRFRRTT